MRQFCLTRLLALLGVYSGKTKCAKNYVHNTAEYPIGYVVFQNTNFVDVILDCLFKTGKSGTQKYLIVSGALSVLWFITPVALLLLESEFRFEPTTSAFGLDGDDDDVEGDVLTPSLFAIIKS
jgi:hypothetical protein